MVRSAASFSLPMRDGNPDDFNRIEGNVQVLAYL